MKFENLIAPPPPPPPRVPPPPSLIVGYAARLLSAADFLLYALHRSLVICAAAAAAVAAAAWWQHQHQQHSTQSSPEELHAADVAAVAPNDGLVFRTKRTACNLVMSGGGRTPSLLRSRLIRCSHLSMFPGTICQSGTGCGGLFYSQVHLVH